MIFQLEQNNIAFPPAELAEEDGLLAFGGDLSAERLLRAYRSGIFPWYTEGMPILWYSPHTRFVLFPEHIKISKSMRQTLKSDRFNITCDEAFEEVVVACATVSRKGQNGTWITPDMQKAYLNLHQTGHAHSVEVWKENRLVGGLYGVQMGKVFCGESMFSISPDASKAALIWLCSARELIMIDCQIYSEHLAGMGAELITRHEYMKILNREIKKQQ